MFSCCIYLYLYIYFVFMFNDDIISLLRIAIVLCESHIVKPSSLLPNS